MNSHLASIKKYISYPLLTLILLGMFSSCLGEVKKKVKQAKQGLSTSKGVIEKAQHVQNDLERLKILTPLTNEQLKAWLPQKVRDLTRTGFTVGKTGYANVASVTGNFKAEDKRKKFYVQIMDGAGTMGSLMVSGMGFVNNIDMEEENENKHLQPVTKEGIRAQQTYYKKDNKTSLQFIYGDRFVIFATGTNMNPKETWEHVSALRLDGLALKGED